MGGGKGGRRRRSRKRGGDGWVKVIELDVLTSQD